MNTPWDKPAIAKPPVVMTQEQVLRRLLSDKTGQFRAAYADVNEQLYTDLGSRPIGDAASWAN
jgi:hypothetical protein